MRDPSWRAALLGRGRDRGEVLAVTASVALLVVTVAVEVLVVWSSGQAALERLVGTGEGALAAVATDAVAAVPPDVPEISELVRQRLDALDGFEPAVAQVTSIAWLVRDGAQAVQPVVRAAGAARPAVLFHRAGAIESLDVVAGPDPAGAVWLPATLAEELDLAPGDRVEVGLDPVGATAERTSATTLLAGTYATVDGRPAGTLAHDDVRLPPSPTDLAAPAPLVLTDAATMAQLGEDLGDLQLSTLRAAVSRPLRYEDLRRGSAQLATLQADLVDAESTVGALIYERFSGPEVRVSSDMRRFVTQAVGTAERVAEQVGGAADAGVVLALATLAAAALAAARRHGGATRLELEQGSAPVGIAGRAVLTMVPAVVVGAIIGRLVVVPLATVVLPAARVPDPAVAALTPRAAATAVAAMGVVLAVRIGDAHVRLRSLGGRGGVRRVPVVPMLVAAAVVVAAGVALGPARAPTDPFLVVLPVVVTAAVAVVVLRALVATLRPDRTGRPSPSAGWLARRRLAGQPDRLVAVGALVATAAGLVANVGVLYASGVVAADAKAAALAGAEVVAGVPGPWVVPTDLPPGLVSVVLEDNSLRALPDEQPVRLLAVDPASFSVAATWPAGTSPSVLDDLAAADGVGLPVLAVTGPTELTGRGTLDRTGWWTLPYEVVRTVPALPGTDPGRPVLLTTQSALFSRLDARLDPRIGPLDAEARDGDGPWSTQVWLDASTAAGLGAAIDLRDVRVVRTLEAIRAQPAFLAGTWSLGVLAGLGAVALALALLLVAATRARPDDEAGLELTMLARLGVTPRSQRHAAVLERVGLVGAAAVVGGAVGTVLAVLVAGAADPAPDLVPALAVVVPWFTLAGALGVLVAGGITAGLLDHRAARRTDVEEALRATR